MQVFKPLSRSREGAGEAKTSSVDMARSTNNCDDSPSVERRLDMPAFL
jgi:hypothetical protein